MPHTILVGGVSLDCTLGSDFLVKTTASIDFKSKEPHLHQGDKTGTALVQEDSCNQEERKDLLNTNINQIEEN